MEGVRDSAAATILDPGADRAVAALYLTLGQSEGGDTKWGGYSLHRPLVCDGLRSCVPLPGLGELGTVPCWKAVAGVGSRSFCSALIIS